MNDFEMRDLFEQVQTMEKRLQALEEKLTSECCKEEQLVYSIIKKVMNMANKETTKKEAKPKAGACPDADGLLCASCRGGIPCSG